jgi:serine/threonine protein phosphatase PrpC
MCRYVRQAPAQPPLGRGAERLLRAVYRQAGDLMVVANVGDSRVVLGTAFDDDAITSSSSSST